MFLSLYIDLTVKFIRIGLIESCNWLIVPPHCKITVSFNFINSTNFYSTMSNYLNNLIFNPAKTALAQVSFFSLV